MTTNKELQNLYDLRFSIKDLKAEFIRNGLIKTRTGSLLLTKLDEAYHWASDLVSEMEDRDLAERLERAKQDKSKVVVNWHDVANKNYLMKEQASLKDEMSKTDQEKFKEMQEQAKQVLNNANAPKTGE
jgi:hypothetical protein